MHSQTVTEVVLGPQSNVWFLRFDVPAFYKEARRVLKPEGALAAWCYWFPQIRHHPEANTVLQQFREQIMGTTTRTAMQRHAENRYKGLQPGPEEFGVVEWDEIPFVQESTIWHLVSAFERHPLWHCRIVRRYCVTMVAAKIYVPHQAA